MKVTMETMIEQDQPQGRGRCGLSLPGPVHKVVVEKVGSSLKALGWWVFVRNRLSEGEERREEDIHISETTRTFNWKRRDSELWIYDYCTNQKTMKFANLPNELILHILQSCTSIADVLALASTCHHVHSILHSSNHWLPTLYLAAEAQYGPLQEAVRIVTHNDSQPVHMLRPAPAQSLALLKQLIEVGRIGNNWADIYPYQKWRGDSSIYRCLLDSTNRYRLRCACYRVWLYSLAFHTPAYSRTTRLAPVIVRQRAQLLRSWSTAQLAELLDMQGILRQVLHSIICPSNGTVIRRHKQRYPDDPFPLVSVTHPGKYATQYADFQRQTTAFHSTPHTSHLLPFAPNEKYQRNHREMHGTTLEGWGDEITHYYVLEDMLKFHPAQLWYLYSHITDENNAHHAPSGFNAGHSSKGLVEAFVANLPQGGMWFENNGETLAETIGYVIGERGGDITELREAIDADIEGIARL